MKTKQEIKDELNRLEKEFNKLENEEFGYGAVQAQVKINIKVRALQWVLKGENG